MATSQQDIVQEILSSMYAYTQQIPTCSTLTNTIGTPDLNIPFDTIITIPRGVIEIDDELIYVMSSDGTAAEAKTAPWGRGYQGTTAAIHNAGSQITVAPLFPRKRINDIINQAIGALSGDLYSVNEYEFTPTSPIHTYTLPDGIGEVLAVSQQTYGPSLDWTPVGRFTTDLKADVSFLGRSITFHQGLRPGKPVKIVYIGQLTTINPGDLLTDSGLDESHRDIVVMASQVKLLMSQDFARLQTQSVESTARDSVVPITSASTIAGRLNQMLQARIDDEKFELMRLYPTRIVRSN